MRTLAAPIVTAGLVLTLGLAMPPQGLLRQKHGAFETSSFAASVVRSLPDGQELARKVQR